MEGSTMDKKEVKDFKDIGIKHPYPTFLVLSLLADKFFLIYLHNQGDHHNLKRAKARTLQFPLYPESQEK